MNGCGRVNLDAMLDPNTVPEWLPDGKKAAVCLSVDDVHPGTSEDAYEAGGDLAAGSLRFVEQLLQRHTALRATLFVTPDWRPLDLVQQPSLLTQIPVLKDYIYWTTRQRPQHLRIDRHPGFVAYLNSMERAEVAMHGLHHLHRGPRFAVEFQKQSASTCTRMLDKGLQIFAQAGLEHAPGFQPPAWNLPDNLIDALARSSLRFVSSARDLRSDVSPTATTDMSGIKGVSLIYPQWLREKQLLHMTCNFQASSDPQRALDIVEAGGLVSIKAHIFKKGGGHTMIDGLDDDYFAFLDRLFDALDKRYGDALWWTSMGEISDQVYQAC